MLPGMLLHVVTASCGVNMALNASSGLQVFNGSFEIMNDSPIFCVGRFGDAEFLIAGNDPASVVDLPSAGRIEGSAIENQGGTVGCWEFLNFGFEVVEKGIVVVEAVCHGSKFIKTYANVYGAYHHRGHGGTQGNAARGPSTALRITE